MEYDKEGLTIDNQQRKLQILACVVKSYTETGEPVGSKSLSSLLNLSSATIRNEMSALEEAGYLTQPHTSAGRIPTKKGFRLYIDKLMRRYDLTDEDKKQIRSMLPQNPDDPEKALEQVSAALAELTRCAAITTSMADEKDRVRRVELIPVDSRSFLLILLTENGIVKSRVCKNLYPLMPDRVEWFLNYVNSHIAGKELSFLQPATQQTLIASLGQKLLEMVPLLTTLFEMIQDSSAADISLEGGVNLLEYADFTPTKAKALIEFLSRGNAVLSILSSLSDSMNVLFGDDIHIKELDESGIVVAKYNFAGQLTGSIGVIGPVRMDYEHIIPSVEYLTNLLATLFQENPDDSSSQQ